MPLQQLLLVNRFEKELNRNMKCFVIILVIVASVATETIVTDNAIDNKESAKVTTVHAPENSLQGLFQTLCKLIEGVLDNDKFVLNMLRINAPLDLTDNQIKGLRRLLESLHKIDADLVDKSD